MNFAKSMDFAKIDSEKFALLARERLDDKNITRSQLAKELNVNPRTIPLMLHGSMRLSPRLMDQLADFLEISNEEIPKIQETKPKPNGNKIFVSYSHRDKHYLDRLMVHLKPLKSQGLVDPWVDTRLLAGDKWKEQIEQALNEARAAILLISADFLASDFIIENELPPLLHAAEEKGTLILPVILKPCRFVRDKSLCEFQAVNPPDEPIAFLEDVERELVYDTVSQRIEDAFGNEG